jgi:PEGA domain-containing protein
VRSAAFIAAVSGLLASTARADTRLEGVSSIAPAKLLIFVVRDEGTPLFANFQDKARAAVEAHMHILVVDRYEALDKGGAEFQKRITECKGEPACLRRHLGAVDAKYVFVITARKVGEARFVGSRLIDLAQEKVLGEAVDELPADKSFLDVLPQRIQASVPPELWDPFGVLSISVNPPGAEITVNGRIVGMSSSTTLRYLLLPGDYKIEASKQGHLPATSIARIDRFKESPIALTLQESAKEESSSWLIWAGLGALAVAGAVTAFAVVRASSGSKDPTFCSAVSRSECP